MIKLIRIYTFGTVNMSVWSRGMILPLGGRGPGFKSPNRPFAMLEFSFILYTIFLATTLPGLHTFRSFDLEVKKRPREKFKLAPK